MAKPFVTYRSGEVTFDDDGAQVIVTRFSDRRPMTRSSTGVALYADHGGSRDRAARAAVLEAGRRLRLLARGL